MDATRALQYIKQAQQRLAELGTFPAGSTDWSATLQSLRANLTSAEQDLTPPATD